MWVSRVAAIVKVLGAGTVRRSVAALGVSLASQIVGFLSQVIRIPLVLGSIGVAQYGLMLVLLSVGAWLQILGTGYQNRTRVGVAEALGAGDARGAGLVVVAQRRRMRASLPWVGMGTVGLLVVIPWQRILDPGMTVGGSEFRGALLAIGLSALLAIPGHVDLGILEAERRTTLAANLAFAGAVLSIPATVVAVSFDAGIAVLTGIYCIALALPYVLASVYARTSASVVASRGLVAQDDDPSGSSFRIGVAMSAIPIASMASTGFDPLIVNHFLGPTDAAVYGVAARLLAAVLAVPIALRPIAWGFFAELRGEGRDPVEICRSARRVIMLSMAGLLVLGVMYVLAGPPLVRLLVRGEIDAPIGLYVANALFAMGFAGHIMGVAALAGEGTVERVAVVTSALALVNLGLSVSLCARFGVSGPAWASAVCLLLTTLLWLWQLGQRPRVATRRPSRKSPALEGAMGAKP